MNVAPVKRWASEVWRWRASYLMLVPFFALFALFIVVPTVASGVLSFTYYNILQPPVWTGWSNFRTLFVDDEIFSLTSGVAMAVVWLVIFANDSYGYLNSILMRMGFVSEPIQWLQNVDLIMPVIIVISLWMSLGTGFLAFLAGFETVNAELYDAGKVDGIRSRVQELWYITIPAMKPQMLFGAVLAVVGSFRVGDISKAVAGFRFTAVWNDAGSSALFTQSEQMKTLPYYLSTVNGQGVARAGANAAATFIMTVPTVLIFVLFQRQVLSTMAHSGIKS